MPPIDHRAWNNFVMRCDPAAYSEGSEERAAAIASYFMGVANNGGLNSFLTCSHDLAAEEVVSALASVGANKAARQLGTILQKIGISLPASTQKARWNLLDRFWTDELDRYDVLSKAADLELTRVLERHVGDNETFYLGLGHG